MPIGFYDTGLHRGFAARPDCAAHRPSSPLGPRMHPVILGYLSHGSYVLTLVWLRSPYRPILVDPPLTDFFRPNRLRKNAFATYLVLLVYFKLAFVRSLAMGTLLFFQAAMRRYGTTCLLSVYPCLFLGYPFRVAPR